MSKCHCGSPTASVMAFPDEKEYWDRQDLEGDSYWWDMAEELCFYCWETRCDVSFTCSN